MRRTTLYLIACMLAYFLYMYTIPAENTAVSAQAAAQPRISAKISLPAVRLYAVSLGNFETQSEALPFAAACAARGAAAYIAETTSGWEILGAGFPDAGDAESVCRRLKENENIDARVVLFSADAMSMSLTATQSQADAITRALELMHEIPEELNKLSAQVDSGLCTPDTAKSLIDIRRTEVSRALEQLSRELGTTADIFSRMTETGLIDLAESLDMMCSPDAPSGLMLSSLMKQCALETTMYMINMINTLSR